MSYKVLYDIICCVKQHMYTRVILRCREEKNREQNTEQIGRHKIEMCKQSTRTTLTGHVGPSQKLPAAWHWMAQKRNCIIDVEGSLQEFCDYFFGVGFAQINIF